MAKFFGSKKIKALIGTIVVDLIVYIVGPEWADSAVQVFTILGGVYIGGQSLADGISGGKTATSK